MKKSAGYLALFSTIAALSLSGCGTATKQEADSEAKADTYVILKAITVGTMPENGMDEFYEELDEMTEELGCHLRFDYIPWGDERSQLNMAIASGEFYLKWQLFGLLSAGSKRGISGSESVS